MLQDLHTMVNNTQMQSREKTYEMQLATVTEIWFSLGYANHRNKLFNTRQKCCCFYAIYHGCSKNNLIANGSLHSCSYVILTFGASWRSQGYFNCISFQFWSIWGFFSSSLHQSIHTSQVFQTRIFNTSVLCVHMLLYKGSQQTGT